MHMLPTQMQEMIVAERENTHFLSRSLSELSQAHELQLLKLESSRAHCEELAVELNERYDCVMYACMHACMHACMGG